MIGTFVITLREGVEAALVIAIAVAYVKRIGRLDLMPAIYQALLTAVVASFIGAWGFAKINLNDDAYEGWVLLVSAAFVLSMVLWMNRHGAHVKSEIETGLQKGSSAGSGSSTRRGVFAFVFLMIFREGVETVLISPGSVWIPRAFSKASAPSWASALLVIFGVAIKPCAARVRDQSQTVFPHDDSDSDGGRIPAGDHWACTNSPRARSCPAAKPKWRSLALSSTTRSSFSSRSWLSRPPWSSWSGAANRAPKVRRPRGRRPPQSPLVDEARRERLWMMLPPAPHRALYSHPHDHRQNFFTRVS